MILPSELALPGRPDQDFVSADLDEVRLAMTQLVAPHELHAAQRGRIAARQTTAQLGNLTVFQIGYGAEVQIEADSCGGRYLAKMPVAGSARVRSKGEEVETDAQTGALLDPDLPLAFEYDANCTQLVISVDAARLQARCADMLGLGAPVRPVRFEPAMNLESSSGQQWMRVVKFLSCEAAAGAESLLASSPLASAPLEQMVMSTLLNTQRHNYSDALMRPTSPAAPRAVLKAEDFMEGHAEEPLTPAGIAKAAGVSERALFRAFQEFRGESPMARLRSIRLARVNRDLLAGEPGRSSVTEIALKWGFSHLGHFGQAYRQRFGETPAQSLQRSH